MLRARVRHTLVAVPLLVWLAVPASASTIPSKATDEATVDTRVADRAAVESFLAREEVARALEANGLTSEDVEQRLAQLSAEDLRLLADNIDQIQTAGEVPQYIWILLAILMAVTILTAVF